MEAKKALHMNNLFGQMGWKLNQADNGKICTQHQPFPLPQRRDPQAVHRDMLGMICISPLKRRNFKRLLQAWSRRKEICNSCIGDKPGALSERREKYNRLIWLIRFLSLEESLSLGLFHPIYNLTDRVGDQPSRVHTVHTSWNIITKRKLTGYFWF